MKLNELTNRSSCECGWNQVPPRELLVRATTEKIRNARCIVVADGNPKLTVARLAVHDYERGVCTQTNVKTMIFQIDTYQYGLMCLAALVKSIEHIF